MTDPGSTCAALGGGTGACTVSFNSPFGTTSGGGLQTDSLIGNDLIATPTALFFDASGPTGGFLRFNSIPGGEVCIGVGQHCAIVAGNDSSVRLNPGHKLVTTPAHPNGADYQHQNFKGSSLVLGTATPVPEPSSLSMMAGGLAMPALFGFMRRRRTASAFVA